jgi:predicted phage terminase large subunit-like protein
MQTAEQLTKISALQKAINRLSVLEKHDKVQKSLLEYAKFQMPEYQTPAHIQLLAHKLEEVERGNIKRLAIFMPPRHGKSQLTSQFFPAWYLGRNPSKFVIATTYAQDLADDFGRSVRNQIQDEDYNRIFNDCTLSKDSSSVRRFHTTGSGVYYAVGAGGAITGRGAHLLLIDDPIKGREDADSDAMRSNLIDWYRSTAYSRLMPGGSIILIQTRWHEDDLAGWILRETSHEPWEVIELPAVLDEKASKILKRPKGQALWPEAYDKKRLEEIKKTAGSREWNSLYMQRPSAEEGNILKRYWWKEWKEDNPPECNYILQSWDTAYTVKSTSDYSAVTTWGIFEHNGIQNAILLSARRERWEFPELKSEAINLYNEFKPDVVLIEAKASGWSLIQELQRAGIPITPFNPKKADKKTRAHSVTPLFESGRVWYPSSKYWAEDVINQCAQFPSSNYDDLVDSTTQALMRLRQGLFVEHPQDIPLEPSAPTGSYW